MSVLETHGSAITPPRGDMMMTGEVIAHLDAQIGSAQRMLQIVLDQGKSITARDVQSVVRFAGMLNVELQRRQTIESDRTSLLERAGYRLGVSANEVTLDLLTRLMDSDSATLARHRSSQLRGLLEELKREHTINRVLMTQELAFLDHLLRLVDVDGPIAYGADGDRPSATPTLIAGKRHVLDLEA